MTLKPSSTNIIPFAPSKLMAAEAPIKIGTKGTVGSLMMKEIEYFNRLEAAATSNVGQPKPKIDHHSVNIAPKRKKRSNKFVPSICSAIDVADHNGRKMVSGFGYRTLKADVGRLQV
ncbi:hypothetical protein HanRHA438_Chr03g0129181 [Helianthus annuus]|uniref:Uncharacterized protein n=1 Tax=Helianthus annuus TaxID=4232 RepID=A0A9K3JGX3_HELAN|nr:uncharacterized protein LOC110932105 [Helianthus annuus]KAF5814980.1 hypothetical protein HanXRQr2_Chr03g0117311 [Helianthus annuus]KAJ0601437.1 hypothetical protein HanIR_Chr03g0128331 [Helianthus annuus]KAJ0936299.1 hypothetical protein HanRHA438_Chr03g0129181 [Helianthus annuus]KAJ0944225.1 hypothetical protein HanPSC8_Chr03g0113841 [Helianthus annuus]